MADWNDIELGYLTIHDDGVFPLFFSLPQLNISNTIIKEVLSFSQGASKEDSFENLQRNRIRLAEPLAFFDDILVAKSLIHSYPKFRCVV
jgi:hypothetical protein